MNKIKDLIVSGEWVFNWGQICMVGIVMSFAGALQGMIAYDSAKSVTEPQSCVVEAPNVGRDGVELVLSCDDGKIKASLKKPEEVVMLLKSQATKVRCDVSLAGRAVNCAATENL